MSASRSGRDREAGPRPGGFLRLVLLLFVITVLLVFGAFGALIINPDLAYLLTGEAAGKLFEMALGVRQSLSGLFADGGPLGGVRRFAEPYLSRVGLNVESILVGLGLLLLTIGCIRLLSVASRPRDEDEEDLDQAFGPVPENPEAEASANPYWPYERRPGHRSPPVEAAPPAGYPSTGRPDAPLPAPYLGPRQAPAAAASPAAREWEAEDAAGSFPFADVTTGDAWVAPVGPDEGTGLDGPPRPQGQPDDGGEDEFDLPEPARHEASSAFAQAAAGRDGVAAEDWYDDYVPAPGRPSHHPGGPSHSPAGPEVPGIPGSPGAPHEYGPAATSAIHAGGAPFPAPPVPEPPETWVRPDLGAGIRKFTVPGLFLLIVGAGGAYGLQTPYAAVITSSPYAGLVLAGAAGVVSALTATWFAAGPMKPVSKTLGGQRSGGVGGNGRARPGGPPANLSNLAPALAPVPRRGGELEAPDAAEWAEVPRPSVFVPWSQNATSLGVDIGSAWIKFVQLGLVRSSLQVVNFGLCSTPGAAVSEGGVDSPEAVGQVLQKLLSDRHVLQKRTVSAIGGQGVIIRHVQFPVMAPEELREVVRWEAEHHIPIPAGDAVIDFTVLPGQGEADERGNRQMRVMLVGAQKAMVNSHVDALKAAKLVPDGLDVEALAAYRVVSAVGHFIEDPARYAQAVIDLGHTTTKLSVYLRGALEMSRALPVGGSAFTRVLSEDLRVSEMEAEVLKRQYGVRSDGGRVLQALAPTLQDLLFEIRRSFEFFSSRHFGQTVRHVYLIGGGARMPGLPEAMSRYLNLSLGERVPEGAALRVDVIDPLSAIAVSSRLTEYMGLIGSEFVTALGLALGGQEALHAS